MKLALLFYHSVYDDQIRGLLAKLKCDRYVEVPRAWAKDEGDQRFGTHIFPGTDSVVLAFVDPVCATRLAGAVKEFQQGRQQEHTHLAIVPLEDFV